MENINNLSTRSTQPSEGIRSEHTSTDIYKQLQRLARFGANLADAFSCFIFLPEEVLKQRNAVPTSGQNDSKLICAGSYSLSQDLIDHARISKEVGLIGWVASHKRSIHVSPFEHDSRTLGVYLKDQGLKSFLGTPIVINSSKGLCGVLACDSKKSFAFSKLQGKLLEELAEQISGIVQILQSSANAPEEKQSWADFKDRTEALVSSLGAASVDVMRVLINGWPEVEELVGTEQAVRAHEQFHRLLLQSLPPHIPYFKTPSGESILVLDNMTSAFYESRVRALCEHIAGTLPLGNSTTKVNAKSRLSVTIKRSQQLKHRARGTSIWDLIKETATIVPHEAEKAAGGNSGQRVLRFG